MSTVGDTRSTDDAAPDGTAIKLGELKGSGSCTGAPFLPAEYDRVTAVASCMPTNNDQDPRFTRIGELIAQVFDTPIGVVGFMASDASWSKGCVGMGHPAPTDRRWSFCTWTLVPLNPEALIAEDLSKDPRFCQHPLIAGPPYLRFYTAVPLVTSTGFRFGTVCAIDYKPRKVTAAAINWLCNIAELVVQEVESTLTCPLPGKRLFRHNKPSFQPVMVLDVKDPAWKVLYGTSLWPCTSDSEGTGTGNENRFELAGKCFWDAYTPMTAVHGPGLAVWAQYKGFICKRQPFQVIVRAKNNPTQLLCLEMRPGGSDQVWDDAVQVSVAGLDPMREGVIDVPNLYFAVLANEDVPSKNNSGAARSSLSSVTSASNGDMDITSGSRSTGVEQSSELGAVMKEDATSAGEQHPLWKQTPFPDVEMGPLLGKGAYGKVYLGFMSKTPVAIKVTMQCVHSGSAAVAEVGINGQPDGQPDAVAEGAVGLRLRHPNVVRTYMWDASKAGRGRESRAKRQRTDMATSRNTGPGTLQTWIVLEYCDRGTLQAAIDKGLFRSTQDLWSGGPDMALLLHVALEVAEGMQYLHSQGVIHGDLSPKNVLLCDNKGRGNAPLTAKICDFGLAREYDHTKGSIAVSNYGTVTHMPSELVINGRLTQFTDVYAFGVILWELYTGQRPFAGYNPVQLVAQRLLGKLHLCFEAPVPPSYKALAEKCMAEDVSLRPTFSAIVAELTDMQQLLQTGQLEGVAEFPVWGDPLEEQLCFGKEMAQRGVISHLNTSGNGGSSAG